MASKTGNPKEHLPVKFTTDISFLPQEEKDAARLLIQAVKEIDALYLLQTGQDLKKQGDVFVKGKGIAVWPEGFTKDELDKFILLHPAQEESLLSAYTVVKKEGDLLAAVPYTEAYKERLLPAAKCLEEAATKLSKYPQFQAYLFGRAQAFKDGSFFANDREWVLTEDAPFELILGPMESYADKILNIKREFEGVFGYAPTEINEKMRMYKEQAVAFDESLAAAYGYKAASHLPPITVIDTLALGGEARYEYIAMACNLPNDPEILEEVGSKKTFYKKVIDAKFENIVRPIVDRIASPDLNIDTSGDAALPFIVGHELAHGLSFGFKGKDFSDLASALEESKADTLGVLFVYFLADVGLESMAEAENQANLHMIDLIRQVRFDLEEAHAIGARIQWNWMKEAGVIKMNGDKLSISSDKIREAAGALSYEFYKLATAKSYKEAENFISRWGAVPEELKVLISKLTDIPVDIDPEITVLF